MWKNFKLNKKLTITKKIKFSSYIVFTLVLISSDYFFFSLLIQNEIN